MIKRWEDDWMHSGPRFTPDHVALSRLFVNDELKALVQFHGTTERYFYTATRFESGSSIEAPEHFSSLGEAKAAVDGAKAASGVHL